ncbi:hypothetical protein [Micromonospora sp. RP3T]|uniref:hypothetical protein n=1 Tax=Micromonospora sp. RP3T TaxID=2135446 RepID=UPI003D7497D4
MTSPLAAMLPTLPPLPPMPPLTDPVRFTRQQAERDRPDILERLAAEVAAATAEHPPEFVASLIVIYREIALRHTDARWWIRHAGRRLGPVLQRELTAADRTRIRRLHAETRPSDTGGRPNGPRRNHAPHSGMIEQ